jgi:hypothetical protein
MEFREDIRLPARSNIRCFLPKPIFYTRFTKRLIGNGD